MSKIEITKTGRGTKAVLRRSETSGASPGAPVREKTGIVDATKEFGLRAMSGLISRLQLANRAGLSFGTLRDYYDVFGYKKQLRTEDFLAKYVRQDIASRIVDAPPGATWAKPPTLDASPEIITAWDELLENTDLLGTMYRADRLARLNHFSVMLFGFDDSASLGAPIRSGGRNTSLLYVRAIGSRQIRELTFDSNERSPRFGMPEMYKFQFDDPAVKSITAGTITVKGLKDITAHWSRTVHIVENALEDTVFGIPIMEKVYNLLDDLLKVAGGTAEMFWLAGNKGLQADIDKDMDVDPADAAALGDEIEEYQHQLRRVIRTRGVTLNDLGSDVPDPKANFDMIMSLISGTTGIPRRILLGSEAGQLASEQDRANWADRIAERRALFVTPGILKPVTSLLQTVGLLPEGPIKFEWPSAFIMSPLEDGMAKAQTARAIGNISRQTGNKSPMQLTTREEGREIIGLEGDLPESELLIEEEDDSQAPQRRPGDEEVPPDDA